MGTALKLRWSIRAYRDIRRLSSRERGRIIAKVEQYASDPDSLRNQVRKVLSSKYLRLRIGDYRVLFTVEHGDIAIMLVGRVRHRREAYD